MTDTIPATVKTPAHTPLPWVINPAHPTYISSADATADICELDGWPVDCVAEENANREFIVRACNSHYQLVEALRGLVNALAENDEDGMTEFSDDMVRARAALSQAGGE